MAKVKITTRIKAMVKIETTTNAVITKIDHYKATATILAKATKRKMVKCKRIKPMTIKTCQKQQGTKPWHKSQSFHPNHKTAIAVIKTAGIEAMAVKAVAIAIAEAAATETEAVAIAVMATNS
jgi:hypothetical protein